MNQVHGLILCGGKSTRMGQDKTNVLFQGKPLLTYAVELFQSINIDFYLSVNSNQKQLMENYSSCIVDRYNEKGPLGGIVTALQTLETDLLIVPVDMPQLTRELLLKLIDNPGTHELVRCFLHNGKVEPFPSLWKQEVAVRLEALLNQGELSLQRCITKLPHHLLYSTYSEEFTNLNYPKDLG